MAYQRVSLLLAVVALAGCSLANDHGHVDLPTIKETNCDSKLVKAKFERCFKIEFKQDGCVEYAGLKSKGFPRILSGKLFNKDLAEISDSRVTMSIAKEGSTAQILIRGSEEIGKLIELKVNLDSGISEVDTVTKDPRFHYETPEEVGEQELTPEQKRELVMQYDMNRAAMPLSFNMKVQFVVEGYFMQTYTDEVDERIAGVANHVENFFLDSSLGVKFHLDILKPVKWDFNYIEIKGSSLRVFSENIKKEVESDNMPKADIYILLGTYAPSCIAGISYSGSRYGNGVCGYLPGKRAVLSWYNTNYGKENDLETALTVVHEIGHALGMKHDFAYYKNSKGENVVEDRYDSQGKSCSRIGGFLDYPDAWYEQKGLGSKGFDFTDRWTTCSVEDFKATYQMYINSDGTYCLEKRVFDDNRQLCNGLDGVIELKAGKSVEIGPPLHIPSIYGGSKMYFDDESCMWQAEAPEGSYVRVDITDFIIEGMCPENENPKSSDWRDKYAYECPDVECTHDYMAVYDGSDIDSPIIAKECGPDTRSQHPSWERMIGPYQSSGNSMLVEFRSNFEMERRGFKAKLSVVNCGEVLYLDEEYTLSTPPGLGENSECVWTFLAPANYNVQLAFEDKSTGGKDCSEYLETYEASSTYSKVQYRICKGEKKGKHYLTTDGEKMTVKLHGSGSWFTAKATPKDFKGAMRCLPQKIDVQDGVETVLTSPEYPEMLSKYNDKSTHCAYVLEAPVGSVIKITFEDLEMDDNYSCNYDSLIFYQGRPTNRDVRLADSLHPMVPWIARVCGSMSKQTAHIPRDKYTTAEEEKMEEYYTSAYNLATIHYKAIFGSKFKVKVTSMKAPRRHQA